MLKPKFWLTRFSRSPLLWLTASGMLVLWLGWLAIYLSPASFPTDQTTIRIYCASAATQPMKQIVQAFNRSPLARRHLVQAAIVRTGGSGELAGQIRTESITSMGPSTNDTGADYYVSADPSRVQSLVQRQTVTLPIVLADQHPVIVTRTDHPTLSVTRQGLVELLELPDLKIAVGARSTAIGSITRRFASSIDMHQQLKNATATEAENVMVLAQAVVTHGVDVAVVWDSTVEQINGQKSEPLRSLGPLDPNHQTTGSVVLVRTTTSAVHSQPFHDYVQQNLDAVRSVFQGYGFSNPAGVSSR